MTQNEKHFCDAAKKVFNEDGSIRVCGRDAVRSLIEAAEQVDPTRDFGNKEIGRMNADTVWNLLTEIEKKE
ncbi:hypothetical protein ACKX2L_06490 [Lachnospiraceae bacterium YH-ros2228]